MSLLLHHRPTYFHFSLLFYYFYWIFLSNSHTPSLMSMSQAHFTTGIDIFSTPYRELNLRPPAPKPIALITTPRCTLWNRSTFFRYDSLLVRGFPRSNVQTYFKRILHEAANAQLWLPLKSLSIKLYLFPLKSVVRELISRYWARRRRQKNPSENVNPDQIAAIQAVKDEVADMLSEIRNILKTNKRSRSRERILRSEEITLEVNANPWNYKAALFWFVLFYQTNDKI